MKIIAAAFVALIAAQAAQAENKPFNVRNGKAVYTAPAAAPSRLALQPAGGSGNNAVANMADPGSDVTAGASGGRAFFGGGASRAFASRNTRGVRRSGGSFWSRNRRIDGGGNVPAPTSTTSTEEEAPPHFSKPGALIRTAGQAPKYAEAEPVRQHTVPAGEIAFNNNRAVDVARSRGVFIGPADTLPPPNPGTTSKTFTSGSGANSGPSSGGGNGGNNNGSGNNDRDIPGDDDDGHGGSKKAGADPTGFYSAF